MSNNYNQGPPQEPQGKLVLGGSGGSSNNSRRRPYQNPETQQERVEYPQQQGQPQGNYAQPPGYQGYPQNYPRQNIQSAPPPAPNPYQAGQQRPLSPTPQLPKRRARRRGGCAIGCLSVALLLLIVGIFALSTAQKLLAFGSAISTQKDALSTQTGYMSTSDRTNVLIMGYGGGGPDGAYLTDSLTVVSLLPQSHHTSLVAVPRDLFVQYPPNSGQYTKINAV